jgi:hypothetical protein
MDPREIPVLGTFISFGYNFVQNFRTSLTDLSLQNYIRLIAIVGAYLLLRPYLMKLVERMQSKDLEKVVINPDETITRAKVSPNMIRGYGGKEINIGGENEEGEGEGTGLEGWGGKARIRQRKSDKVLVEEVERRRLAQEGDGEDKDIEEFLVDGKDVRDLLVDYEEGVDGW